MIAFLHDRRQVLFNNTKYSGNAHSNKISTENMSDARQLLSSGKLSFYKSLFLFIYLISSDFASILGKWVPNYILIPNLHEIYRRYNAFDTSVPSSDGRGRISKKKSRNFKAFEHFCKKIGRRAYVRNYWRNNTSIAFCDKRISQGSWKIQGILLITWR